MFVAPVVGRILNPVVVRDRAGPAHADDALPALFLVVRFGAGTFARRTGCDHGTVT